MSTDLSNLQFRKGYFQHPTAIVESDQIGEGTRIWAYAHILSGAKIGRNCNICDHTFIENDVVIGDRVTVKCGVQIWDGLRVEDDVFIGPNATFTNDLLPRSKQYKKPLETILQKGASIGANATILPGITIGQRAMIGAGAVVTHSVPPHARVAGNPAGIIGYVDTIFESPAEAVRGGLAGSLPFAQDARGMLSYGETLRHIPFEIKRYFLVFGVPSRHVRGEHAHRTLHQFLICVAGQCNLVTDDGIERHEYVLDSPAKGVHLPPMVWGIQYKFSPDAVLLVLASDYYDADDYIRDYEQFRALLNESA